MKAPQFTKLVWQGTLSDKTVRVVVAKESEDDIASTLVEEMSIDGMGDKSWLLMQDWVDPADAGDDRMAFVIEGLVDLVGRPEWDKRNRSERHYPHSITLNE